MIYGYCRVSTKGQAKDGNSLEEQTLAIKNIYTDAEIIVESYSGAKERPLFNELLEKVQNGDYIVVTKLDRFCRATKEGLEYIDLLMNKGVKIHILNMGLIEASPMGRLIVTNLLAFAEFERAMIIERTQEGKSIARAKAEAEGKEFKDGRKKVYDEERLDHALKLLKDDRLSYTQVTKLTGISKSTLIRHKRKRELEELEKK